MPLNDLFDCRYLMARGDDEALGPVSNRFPFGERHLEVFDASLARALADEDRVFVTVPLVLELGNGALVEEPETDLPRGQPPGRGVVHEAWLPTRMRRKRQVRLDAYVHALNGRAGCGRV